MSLQARLIETDTDRDRRPESGGRARERERDTPLMTQCEILPPYSLATNLIEFHISLIAKALRDDVESMRSALHNILIPVASAERGRT